MYKIYFTDGLVLHYNQLHGTEAEQSAVISNNKKMNLLRYKNNQPQAKRIEFDGKEYLFEECSGLLQ